MTLSSVTLTEAEPVLSETKNVAQRL